MAKPAGLQSKLKDNSKKNYRSREEWTTGKKVGRKKQEWVFDVPVTVAAGEKPTGHWEKVQ
jgi:hypothetical protein